MPKKSPFPGMDPYLESHWGDVHHRLIQYASDQLQEQLPDRFRARVEERVFVESGNPDDRNIYPDIRIVERQGISLDTGFQLSPETGGVLQADPLILQVTHDSMTEGFIEIRDASSGNRVVTVIEVLSSANKAGGRGTKEYRKKQQEVLTGSTSLVEIDLLRTGRRMTAVPWKTIPPSHRTTYHICVKRGWRGDKFEIYRVPLRERLPTIGIPLRRDVADVRLDLQSLLEPAYRTGRYDDIDYREDPEMPLDYEDAKWADELLRREGRR